MENTDSERSCVCPTWKPEEAGISRASPVYSVMVSVAVSILGTTELMFIEPGVKINGAYYGDVLLGQHHRPVIRSVAGDFFTFQQDNAPAHRAGDTVEFFVSQYTRFNLTVAVAAQ